LAARARSFRGAFHLTANEFRNRMVINECDAANLAAFPNSHKFPVPELLRSIVEGPAEAEIRIDTQLGESEKLWTLRSTRRRFAWRGSCRFGFLPTDGFNWHPATSQNANCRKLSVTAF
jgi:hypothetical protein